MHIVPEDFIVLQFQNVTNDMAVDALKIGIHLSLNLIKCIVSLLNATQIPIVIIDPVIISRYLSADSLTILREQLLPLATLITPILYEATIPVRSQYYFL